MNPRALLAAGIIFGALAAHGQELSALLRPDPIPVAREAGAVPLSRELELKYALHPSASHWRRELNLSGHDAKAFDQRFSVSCDIPLAPDFTLINEVSAASNDPYLAGPVRPHAPLSLTRQTTRLTWQMVDRLTLSISGGGSHLHYAPRAASETAVAFGIGGQVVLIDGVSLSADWMGNRILPSRGSFASTYSAAAHIALSGLPVSLQGGYYRTDQSFDGLPEAPYRMTGLHASLTWEVQRATAVTIGYHSDQYTDATSRSAGSYQMYYFGVSVRPGRALELSVQAARDAGTLSGAGETPYWAEYGETSLKLGIKVHGRDGFETELGARLRNTSASGDTPLHVPVILLSGRFVF